MSARGWMQLIPSAGFGGAGSYPLEAYSEFLPPPRIGWKPYGDPSPDPEVFAADDPWGCRVSEFEEARELAPGLLQVARQVLPQLARLLDGDPRTDIPRLDL